MLRIGIIAPPFERVPPPKYGGTERIVSLLTEGLVERGHDVTLFATGDAITNAKLKYLYKTPMRDFDPDIDERQVEFAFAHTADFDLIHDHTYLGAAVPYFYKHKLPIVTTLHNLPIDDWLPNLYRKNKLYPLISISNKQKEYYLGANFISNVYNGIDLDTFPLNLDKHDYMLHLGAITERKGSHIAIEVALKSRKRLILAGKVDDHDRDWFQEKIEPHLKNDLIEYVGEVGGQTRIDLFRNARALLFPSVWDEPFGLVLIEAMACGTPVIAFRKGSIPEVVSDRETGYIVDTLDEMCQAVNAIDAIDPLICRNHVEVNFSKDTMIDGYERVYSELLKGQ